MRLSANALCRLEEESGVGAVEFFGRFESGKMRISDVRLVIWCALEGEPQTRELVGDLIDDMGLEAAVERTMAAVQAAFPQPEPEAKAKRGNAKGTAV